MSETTAAAPSDEDAAASSSSPYDKIPFDDSRVVKYPDPVLRQKARPINAFDAQLDALIADMEQIMYSAHGVGLAAPQVGRSIRLLVYDAGEGFRVLVNPSITKMKGEQLEPEEGCLSIPGLRGQVRRAREVVVKAQDRNGRGIRLRATDFEARILQHEIDHLDGILFIDRADASTLHMGGDDSEGVAE